MRPFSRAWIVAALLAIAAAPARAQFWGSGAIQAGTTAERPSSCKPGKMFFATDAEAGNNLYLCTASDTWTQLMGQLGLGNVENTALSTWPGSASITTIGPLGSYVKAPKQINFSLYDPTTALAAATIPGIWRAEYGAATVTAVNCASDTNNAQIQIKKNTGTNMLSATLTCNGWATTSSFAAATLALGDDIGLQIIGGTAKRINVSIKYTQQ